MRRFGIPPATAKEMVQWDQAALASQPFYPLPSPTGTTPYRMALSSVIPEPGQLVLHVIGDHGGVKDPNPQQAVAKALVEDQGKRPVSACYSVGDVVYFNGAESEYPNQFGEPYSHYNVPILAIPGNHDGDPEEDHESSLAGFMRHFCDTAPRLLPDMAEFQRDTMTQPNCYWTLQSEHATIIGLYSNVPSGGQIETGQVEWLVGELQAAPAGVPLVVSLHHPPYSVDAHHGGSTRMGTILDSAFDSAKRCPDLVLAGHVHDAQFFTRTGWGRTITYVVIGNGGYHNLHGLATGATPGEEVTKDVRFDYGDDKRYGFMRATFSSAAIDLEYVAVGKDGTVTPAAYTATVPVGASAS